MNEIEAHKKDVAIRAHFVDLIARREANIARMQAELEQTDIVKGHIEEDRAEIEYARRQIASIDASFRWRKEAGLIPADATIEVTAAAESRAIVDGILGRAQAAPAEVSEAKADPSSFRGCGIVTEGGDYVLLTGPQHAGLSDEDLIAEAMAEAERADLIGDTCRPRMSRKEVHDLLQIDVWDAPRPGRPY